MVTSKLKKQMKWPKDVMITYERKRTSLIALLQLITNQKCLHRNHTEDINTNLLLMQFIMLAIGFTT